MNTSREPRVLVCGAVLGQPMGGVRRHSQELLSRAARSLAAGGGGLAILAGRVPPALELPASVERLSSGVPAGPPFARALREGRAVRAALARAARAGRAFDLVHTAHLPAPRCGPTPMVLTIHDLRRLEPELGGALRRALARAVLRDSLARARLVLTVSEHVRAELAARFALDPERLRVVPNAADHLPLVPRVQGPARPILCVAHLEPRKNQALLLRALAHDAALPELLLAGAAVGGERARLEALARELGVSERVRYLGPVSDGELARLYARAGCLVLPSLVEGFGIPVLEAQRAGCPVAVADAGALPEVAGAAVPRFSPHDAAACAAALRRALAATPAEIEAQRARAAARRWDDVAAELVEAWRSVRERPAP